MLLNDDEFYQKWGEDSCKELTLEERYNYWFNNNYETGMERYFNPNNLPDFEDDYYEPTPKRKLKDMNKIEYDPFVMRQFSQNFSGTKVPLELKDNLLEVTNRLYDLTSNIGSPAKILPSAWDFCKYLVIPNDFNIKCAVREITLDIYPYIRTDYSQRTPDELAILTRYVQLPPGFPMQEAKYIVFVLYSKEQLEKEFKPKEGQEFYFDDSVEWGVVSIMGTMEAKPDPLVPITIMRNALGIEEGGNGETLNKESYNESVDFWKKYILVK
jgi:hypothetical protein